MTVGSYRYNLKRDAADFDVLKKSAVFRILQDTYSEKEENMKTVSNIELPDINVLYEMNKDTIGWLIIPDTVIDYPVMYTPQEPEYYLNRNFDKKYSRSGIPFADANCSFDMDSDNIIIYGHNMKNGSMFTDLLDYKEKGYWEEHKEIIFSTLFNDRRYEIIAALYVNAADMKEIGIIYSIEFPSKDKFDVYIDYIMEKSLYETGIDAAYGDKLITLSTCSYHVKNGRFVVIARSI